MADGGCGNETRSALDGAFLLHLLRNPPQSQPRPPPPSLPHEFLHRDPAVAAFVPSLAFPHNLAPPPPRPAPQAPPPGFGRDHWAPPPPEPQPQPQPPPGFSLPGSNRLNSPLPAAQFVQSPSLGNDLRGSPVRPQGRVDRSVVKPPGSEKWFRRMGNADASVAESSYWQNHGPSERKQSYGMKGRNGQWANHRNSLFPRPGLVEQGRPPGMEWKSRQQQDGNKREERSLPYSQRESLGSPPGGASRSSQRSIDGLDIAESLNGMQLEEIEEREIFEAKKHVEEGCRDLDMVAEQFEEVLRYEDENRVVMHSKSVRGKDLRIDSFRGHHVSSQRMRFRRRELECRRDIENFSPLFLSIYNSLTPADEEKAKQIQLLQSLGRLVNKEWPTAQLHLYGSCANSFGVSKSDIDVCLAIDDSNLSKAEILLKLADILESDNLQEVQALTHARVPIVKMMDPVTGISCDICINNLLAVANTKLLRDYAQIDDRLRQLAFIVKHWAKSRGVNETYRGTLSSYAYVLMCIHFLQLRRPAILPCLQEMEATYLVTIEDTKCAYFDQVDRLRNFGARNKESIARLLWTFFHYWAYCHDYTNDVISVRTGRVISKRMKDWTRRIGNDRHLICIEDPFETSHDLGRVVDKYSIKILREEFERAADILQYDPNPSVTLFEPYIPGSVQNGLESDLNQ